MGLSGCIPMLKSKNVESEIDERVMGYDNFLPWFVVHWGCYLLIGKMLSGHMSFHG